MSTLDDLDAAIRDHISTEHPGQMVAGWAIVASTTIDGDEGNDYDTIAPDWQPAHHTIGLYRLGMHLVLNTGEDDQ